MDYTRIRYMKEWVSQLPPGNISYKTINGKRYPYYQWTENGKQHSRIVKAYECDELSEKIEQRKVLEKKIREAPEISIASEILDDNFYFSMVKTGQELIEFAEPVNKYKNRGSQTTGYLSCMASGEPERLRLLDSLLVKWMKIWLQRLHSCRSFRAWILRRSI